MRAPTFTTLLAALSIFGCETETPTTALVRNDYPAVPDGGDPATEVTVWKAWYVSSVFLDPVAPGGASDAQRTVSSSDYVYAIVAPGWDPSSMTPPAQLIPVRSKGQLSVKRGDTLTIAVSDATFDGRCAGGSALSQEDADFVTQRIFPGDFTNVRYDAKSCTSTPIPADSGTIDATPADAGDADAPDD